MKNTIWREAPPHKKRKFQNSTPSPTLRTHVFPCSGASNVRVRVHNARINAARTNNYLNNGGETGNNQPAIKNNTRKSPGMHYL